MKHTLIGRPTNWPLLLANIIGAILYVVRASQSWAIPAERGINSISGEPFIWALFALPILAVFAVIDLVWGIIVFRNQKNGARFLLIAGLIWIVAIVVDFAHH